MCYPHTTCFQGIVNNLFDVNDSSFPSTSPTTHTHTRTHTVFEGLPPSPGQLCKGEDSKWTLPSPFTLHLLHTSHCLTSHCLIASHSTLPHFTQPHTPHCLTSHCLTLHTPPHSTLLSLTVRIYHRRGARRWKKVRRINGHAFIAKRFQVCLPVAPTCTCMKGTNCMCLYPAT